jgi:hypothetical protein
VKKIALIFSLVFLPLLMEAQPGDPGDDPDVPIPGIGWLLAAGGIYGVKKVLDGRNRKNLDGK